MTNKQRKTKFSIGDRVAEKPKPRAIFTNKPGSKEKIKPFTTQRYGTVLDTIYKSTSNGNKVPYVKIMWDNSSSPAVHSQNRICLQQDLASEVNNYFNATS